MSDPVEALIVDLLGADRDSPPVAPLDLAVPGVTTGAPRSHVDREPELAAQPEVLGSDRELDKRGV